MSFLSDFTLFSALLGDRSGTAERFLTQGEGRWLLSRVFIMGFFSCAWKQRGTGEDLLCCFGWLSQGWEECGGTLESGLQSRWLQLSAKPLPISKHNLIPAYNFMFPRNE